MEVHRIAVISDAQGSYGAKRFRLPITMVILTLFPKEHRIEQERIKLTSTELVASYADFPHLSDKDMYKLIKTPSLLAGK